MGSCEARLRLLAAGNAVDSAVKTQLDGFADLRVHVDRNAIQHQRVVREIVEPGLFVGRVRRDRSAFGES